MATDDNYNNKKGNHMKISTLKAIAYALGAATFAFLPAVAGAVTIGEVSSNVSNNFSALADLLSGGAYLAGAALGIQAALKFKEHNADPRQVKLSQPMTYALVAGALLALPSFIGTATDTMWGSGGGRATQIQGGGSSLTSH